MPRPGGLGGTRGPAETAGLTGADDSDASGGCPARPRRRAIWGGGGGSSGSSSVSPRESDTRLHCIVGTVAHAGPLGRRRSSAGSSRFGIAGHLALPCGADNGCAGNKSGPRVGALGPEWEGGYGLDHGTATSARAGLPGPSRPYRTFAALVIAGFRRYSTYRQATLAGICTNTVFGFLNCSVLLAVAAGRGGSAAGYSPEQLATYVWINQGLLATVGIWGDTQLADRIRSGEVVSDLLRPVHPVITYLGVDVGRAGFAVLTRFAVPMIVGALAFHLRAPTNPGTYPLFLLAVLLALFLSFACRYLVNATAYWLLDSRGPQVAWSLLATLLGGLSFPLHFLPSPVLISLWFGTPFPSLLQGPVDIFVERGSVPMRLGILAVQAGWVAIAYRLCWIVQRAAERKLVVQGG
jgi:ABC-2 type transport system permease protein